MLKSRETLIQDAKNAIKEPKQLAMVLDLIDSAWQWRTGGAQEATRERWVTVGGQTKKGSTTDEAGPKTQDGGHTSVSVVGTAGPQGERGPAGATGPAGADGKDGAGSVTSVGLSLGAAMDAIANVSSSPVVTSGNIGLELSDQPSSKALMSPVSGTGKPSFRQIEQGDIPGGPFLSLAGGEMASSAAIQWPDGGSGTITFSDDDGSWTVLQRDQLYFSPSAGVRSGAFLQTHEYGGSQFGLTTKAASGTQDVLLYGKNGGGGYATFNRRNGDLAVALGAGYGDNGEIRVENASGAETFNHSSEFDSTYLSGVLVAGSVRSNSGLGLFGATPPTSRPTVNAACTDIASCIALTNQLRTHLIACGLVQ